jgi:hypothetical protein
MEIDTKGLRTLIQPEWSRYQLKENLKKIGLSLTSIHAATGQNISIFDSLATCLIQHASNRYDGISNLDEAWESVISKETKEEDWIQFRVRLEKKRQELLTLSINNYQNFKKVVDEVILALEEFQWFQLTSSRHFTLFFNEWKIEIAANSRESSTTAKCFIWYDKEFETFNGITKWSQTFADPQVYRLALVCQLDQSLKNFFRLLLSDGNPNDDELATRITGYLKDITNSGRKIEDHEALLVQWNCSDDGLKILIKDLLNPSFVEGNRRDDIENELKIKFIESMEKATQEIQIERLESYEKFRLEAIKDEDERERKKRRLNSQIKESEGEIARLEQELTIEEESNTTTGRTDKTPKLQKSDSQLSRAAMLVLTKRNNLQKKKEKLAWDRFRSLLSGSLPRYELARQRRNHRIFGDQYSNVTDFADDVINEFVLKEKFIKKEDDLSNLKSFIEHNTSDAKTEIVRILEDMVKEPMQITTNPKWKFDGNVLVLSQILDKVKPKMPLTCEEIHICATSVLYIDCDWVIPGISLGISAPRVETVGQRTIDTSGHHAKQIGNKNARDGVGPGVSGDKGLNGDAGQSAGHISIQCDTFYGSKLSIRACGGNGADGQNGGNGMPGSDGKDGEDAKLKPPAEVDQNYSYIPLTLLKWVPVWGAVEVIRSIVHYFQGSQFAIKYLEKGSEGERGISGGSGGPGGWGGEGGKRGKIDIQCQLGSNLIEPVVAEDGEDGKNGTSGKGATGGKGGRNGWDAARVFTPNDLNPWFYISGDWVEDRGNLSIQDVHCTSNNAVLGCRIVKKDEDKAAAANGQHGEDGKLSESSEKNKTVPKKTMSKVNADWKKQESTASVTDLEQSIQADAASLQSAEAAAQRHEELSKASEETEKQARAAAEQQQANEQKLKHAKEIEERIKKEFQKAKKMCSAQSMQSQRTNRITDQLPNESEPKEAEEELFSGTNNTIQTIPITSGDEWDSLEGVSLLDALIETFSEDAEKSQTLSMLTQSLVLQIHQKDLWIEVTDIVRRHVDCVDDLIQSLKYINQDIELAQLFVFNKEEHLLDDLHCAIRDKTSGFTLFNDENKEKTLATIYYFQQLTWDYKEIGSLLKPLEIDSPKEKSPSNSKIQLIDILGHRLVSIVASLLPGNQEKQQKLLKDLFGCCRRSNNSSNPVLFGTFFNNLVTALEKNTTSDTTITILNKFIVEKLGVVRVQDLLPSKMKIISTEQLDKVAFLLNNVKTDVKDLDDIRSRVRTLLEKNKVEEKEPFKKVLFLIEKAFEQFYWNQEWNEIQKMLIRFREKVQRQAINATISKEAALERDAFQDSVDRLKQALTWTYCRKSYQQNLDVCNELKKRFKNTDWKDFIKIDRRKASKLSFEKTVNFCKYQVIIFLKQ